MTARKCANAPKCHNDAQPGERFCLTCEIASWQDEHKYPDKLPRREGPDWKPGDTQPERAHWTGQEILDREG